MGPVTKFFVIWSKGPMGRNHRGLYYLYGRNTSHFHDSWWLGLVSTSDLLRGFQVTVIPITTIVALLMNFGPATKRFSSELIWREVRSDRIRRCSWNTSIFQRVDVVKSKLILLSGEIFLVIIVFCKLNAMKVHCHKWWDFNIIPNAFCPHVQRYN